MAFALPGQVFASAGDVVTCTGGHPIVTFARQVMWGDRFDPAVFRDWQQPEPSLGTFTSEIKCTLCGGRWVDNQHYHFKDGWR